MFPRQDGMPYIDRTSKYSRMRPKRDTVGYLHKLPLTEISSVIVLVIIHVIIHMILSTKLCHCPCYHPCYHPQSYVIVHRAILSSMLSSMLLSICPYVHVVVFSDPSYRQQNYVIVHVVVFLDTIWGGRYSLTPGLGISSFQKNATFLHSFPFFSILYKRMQRSLCSFPFFIKERNVFCVLFRSL